MFKIARKTRNSFEMIAYGALRPEEMGRSSRIQDVCTFEKAVENLVVMKFELADAYFMMLRLVSSRKSALLVTHYRSSPVGEQLILSDPGRGVVIQADEATIVYYLERAGESRDSILRLICNATGKFPDPDRIGEPRFLKLFGRSELIKAVKAA